MIVVCPGRGGRGGIESKDRISTYENLTSYRKKIVNEAKGMRRNGELLKVCTMDGQIYFKPSPEGRPIRIMEPDDLKNPYRAFSLT